MLNQVIIGDSSLRVLSEKKRKPLNQILYLNVLCGDGAKQDHRMKAVYESSISVQITNIVLHLRHALINTFRLRIQNNSV